MGKKNAPFAPLQEQVGLRDADVFKRVEEARAGDPGAREYLVRRAMTSAMRTASAVLADRDAASDVAQDVALDVIRGLSKLRDPARFDAWVHRIATRKALRAAAARRRRLNREAGLGEEAEAISDPAAPAGSAERLALSDAVVRALALLSERQRAAVVLRYVHDLTEAEVARALRCSPGTAASLLFRARQRLEQDPDLRALSDRERSP